MNSSLEQKHFTNNSVLAYSLSNQISILEYKIVLLSEQNSARSVLRWVEKWGITKISACAHIG